MDECANMSHTHKTKISNVAGEIGTGAYCTYKIHEQAWEPLIIFVDCASKEISSKFQPLLPAIPNRVSHENSKEC